MDGSRMGEPQDRSPEDAAAFWLVALRDDPEDGELRAAFADWHAADPAHARAWQEVAEVHALMALTPAADRYARPRPRPVESGSTIVAFPATRRRDRWRTRRTALAMAAGVLLVVLSAPVLFGPSADMSTATGEVRMVRLEDGSTVHLGPESALDVALGDTRRDVRLTRGVGFFDVARDAGRPFTVGTDDAVVTVLGTAFEVDILSGATRVRVREGRVAVRCIAGGEGSGAGARDADQPPLHAGDWQTVCDGPGGRGHQAAAEVAPWMDGQIIAHGRPVREVVAALGAYVDGAVLLTSDTLGAQRVTGVYNTADPLSALRAVVAVHGGSLLQVTPWLLIIREG